MKLASAVFMLGASMVSGASLQADGVTKFVSLAGDAVEIKNVGDTKLKLERVLGPSRAQ